MKTTALVNFIERMPYTKILCISPTMNLNKDLMKRLHIKEEDIYPDPNDITIIDKIKQKIEAMARDWDQYLADLKRWNAFQKALTNANQLFQVSDNDLLSFFHGGDFMPPKHKEKDCIAIFFDDCLGSALFSKGSRKLNSMVILHRYLGQLKEGGALGASLYFLVQSYKCSNSGGITKSIRNNATTLILFHTKSQKGLDEIAEECSAEVDTDTFMKLVKEAHKEPHDFLLIDLHKKDNHPSGFRRNLDTFLIPTKKIEL